MSLDMTLTIKEKRERRLGYPLFDPPFDSQVAPVILKAHTSVDQRRSSRRSLDKVLDEGVVQIGQIDG